MANEGPKQDWGWGISGFDARDSLITGTTRNGPNGSAQFLAVGLSTAADLTVLLSTVAGSRVMGILQNKPSLGVAADVTVWGFTKAVAGLTITPNQELQVSSTAPGTLIPFSSAAGTYAIGVAPAGATIGSLFSAYLYGTGGRLA